LIEKRVYLLILLLTLFSSSVLAELNITLNHRKVSYGQPFDGTLNLTFDQPAAKDRMLVFIVRNSTDTVFNITLAQALQSLPYTLISPRFDKTGDPVPAPTLVFSSAGSQMLYALDLSQGGINKLNDISELQSFNLSLEGTANNNLYPQTVRIDIGNDQNFEYTYKGPVIPNMYTDFDTSYLGNSQPSSEVILRGATTDMYCEQVTLAPATSYRISAKIRKLNTGNLSATLTRDLPGTSESFCTADLPCCALTTSATSLTDSSCILQKDIQQQSPGYLCIFIKEGDPSQEYYALGQKEGNSQPKGYLGGSPSRRDYFIWGAWQNYEKDLKTTVRTSISNTALAAIKKYAGECAQKNCLLVPLNISVESAGKLTLKNLELKFIASGVQILTSFLPIQSYPERIAPQSYLIDMSTLTHVIAPNDLGINREMYVTFQGERSNIIQFDVVKGPTAVAKKNKAIVKIGESVFFYANQSQPINTSFKTFSWNFGDGSTQTGSIVTHSYTKTGFYTVTLKAVDQENLLGITTTLVEVRPTNATTLSIISDSLAKVETLKNKINSQPSLQTSADLLGITPLLDSAFINLTAFKQQAARQNDSKNDSSLAVRADALMQMTPVDLNIINTLRYDARTTLPSEVPAILNTENTPQFQERVYASQSPITTEAHLIKIQYPQRDELFILVIKKVQANGAIYELLPPTLTQKKSITPVAEAVSPTLLRYESKDIVYTLAGATLDDLTKTLQTRTLVIPAELAPLPAQTPSLNGEFSCGNTQCEAGENALLCPQDCPIQRPYTIIAVILTLALLIVAYIFLYKGRYSFHDFFVAKKSARSLYRTERDYLSVKTYLEHALDKGFNQEQVILALKKKGWTTEQINATTREVQQQKGRGK